MPKEVLPKNGKNMMKLGALYGNGVSKMRLPNTW